MDSGEMESKVPRKKSESEASEGTQSEASGAGVERKKSEVTEVPISETAEEVEFVHARLRTSTGFEFLRAVRKLNLRRNLIKEIRGLGSLVTLEELELYDNQITLIEGLETLVNLRHLDLSYNRIGKMEGLEGLVNLRKLYLVHNKVAKMEGMGSLAKLELLELGDNKIRAIEGLESCTALEKLFLGKNKIRKLEGLGTCTRLTQLSIQANRITVLENVAHLAPTLVEFYASENGLKEIGPGLAGLGKLEILDLAVNFISAISGVAGLRALTDFWFNDNLVKDWGQLGELQALPKLSTLYLHGNPIERRPDNSISPDYRRKMLLLFPRITRLDAIPCRPATPS